MFWKTSRRVGGTSAGAINATLFALGYSIADQRRILKKLDFNNFMDDNWGLVRDTQRLIEEFGWYKGDFFHHWISGADQQETEKPPCHLQGPQGGRAAQFIRLWRQPEHRFGEIFSVEHTPTTRIADAVRISMSIPLFFAAFRNARKDVYVDGGLLNNYPVKLFDRDKYIEEAKRPKMGVETVYYKEENARFLKKHPAASRYVYNKETLGFRLDSKQEIGVFRTELNRSMTPLRIFSVISRHWSAPLWKTS